MKYKLVIFDFDGTLADSLPWFFTVADLVADKYKLKRINKDDLETLRTYGAEEMLNLHGVSLWKVPMIANYVRKLLAKDIHQIKMFAGIDGLIKQLSEKGMRLAVLTSNSCENVRQVLGPVNSALIDYYECGVSVFGKPPKLRKLLHKSGVDRNEVICIGDEIRDIVAANHVNIPFGAVAWGYTSIEALKAFSPSEVFACVEEIAEKII